MIDKNYRDPDTVSAEIHDTQLILMQVREAIKEHPQDEALHFLVQQETRQIDKLTKELEEALTYKRRHVLKYMIDTDVPIVRLDMLGDLMTGMQELLNKTFQKLTGKEKTPMPLYLNTTFKGSFGLMISTDSEQKLINAEHERVIKFVFDSITGMQKFAEDEDGMHDYLMSQFSGDLKFINKFKDFYGSIAKSGSDIKLEWVEHKKEPVKTRIKVSDAKRYHSRMNDREKSVYKDVKMIGKIMGISLIKKEIEFQTSSGVIKASFDKKMEGEVENNFKVDTTAFFDHTVKHNAVTDSEVESWKLKRFLIEV